MTDTERRYAQIKKEALAVTWACEKFFEYVLGKDKMGDRSQTFSTFTRKEKFI